MLSFTIIWLWYGNRPYWENIFGRVTLGKCSGPGYLNASVILVSVHLILRSQSVCCEKLHSYYALPSLCVAWTIYDCVTLKIYTLPTFKKFLLSSCITHNAISIWDHNWPTTKLVMYSVVTGNISLSSYFTPATCVQAEPAWTPSLQRTGVQCVPANSGLLWRMWIKLHSPGLWAQVRSRDVRTNAGTYGTLCAGTSDAIKWLTDVQIQDTICWLIKCVCRCGQGCIQAQGHHRQLWVTSWDAPWMSL